jgi:GTP pyrophosphokinase
MGRLEDKALEFAAEKHKGQLDDQGRPYFFAHIVQVHGLLNEVTDDEETLCAGLLHDVLEDTETSYEELIREFNKEIADLVMELTYEGCEDSGRYFPRLYTRKAIVIKFADRLSNLARMVDWPGDWQQDYLDESKFWHEEPWKDGPLKLDA